MKRIVGTLSLLVLALSGSVLLAESAPAMAPALALPVPPQLAVAAPALPAWLIGAPAPAQPVAAPPDFLRPQAIPNCTIPCKGVHCAGFGFCRYNPDTGGCGCVYP